MNMAHVVGQRFSTQPGPSWDNELIEPQQPRSQELERVLPREPSP